MDRQTDILCIGAVLWDVIGRTPRSMAMGHDVPGRIKRAPGGVAMNIAMALVREGLKPAQLTALAETPVTVVCAGAKAILDLPKTLEVLEALGVPVIAVGQDDLPAFWSRTSGLTAPLRLETASEIAAAHQMRRALGLPGGQLVANPIPAEAEIPAGDLAPIIAQAQVEADAQGVSAKAVTPFLLQRIYELTDGRSLDANIALVLSNARLASGIAAEISECR